MPITTTNSGPIPSCPTTNGSIRKEAAGLVDDLGVGDLFTAGKSTQQKGEYCRIDNETPFDRSGSKFYHLQAQLNTKERKSTFGLVEYPEDLGKGDGATQVTLLTAVKNALKASIKDGQKRVLGGTNP
ncbi:MAG: hypothetical protein AAFO91_05310 [Bacteroidota bacterium]